MLVSYVSPKLSLYLLFSLSPSRLLSPLASSLLSPPLPSRLLSPLVSPPFPSPPPSRFHILTAMPSKLDTRISACVAYFATDVHSRTLGPNSGPDSSPTASPQSNHTLDRLSEIRAEVAMIFGVRDTHVPDGGRDLVRAKLREASVTTSFYEFAWAQHAFIRDELSKGRYDPAISKICFEILLELFQRTLKVDLGNPAGHVPAPDHVC